MSLYTKDYNYDLPSELIASRPLVDRSASRMLVLDRKNQTITHKKFTDFPNYITDGDLLILNNTRVIPARVYSDDKKLELLCLDRPTPCLWRCLAKPGKRMKVGKSIVAGGIKGIVVEVLENGDRMISWESEPDLDQIGHLALPHYMNREDEESDKERYQTVYAKEHGAIAAPTAGLHFTEEMLQKIHHDFITLHVGVGTFRPVSVDQIDNHVMHSEKYSVLHDAVDKINRAKRVIAVGTTVTRVLESLSDEEHRISPTSQLSSQTSIFIHPPHKFQAVDALLTNFHLPESTLIMLVSALAGREFVLEAYRQAVLEKYRFYSYGDCMLVI